MGQSDPRCLGPVLSAQAEVVQSPGVTCRPGASALRAGGGGSILPSAGVRIRSCSPRRRRWFASSLSWRAGRVVPSAQAEVVRPRHQCSPPPPGALRAGGGGSPGGGSAGGADVCSPRRRRWFAMTLWPLSWRGVLSAQAEVVRRRVPTQYDLRRALRAGGGGSKTAIRLTAYLACSPRRRRWFADDLNPAQLHHVLSAQAEVVRGRGAVAGGRGCALRAGGGGSASATVSAVTHRCSPRRRRWFGQRQPIAAVPCVLSAQAEVVRRTREDRHPLQRALRAGGGGSSSSSNTRPWSSCSPRRRRWFATPGHRRSEADVLSAQVEAVRTASRRAPRTRRALRAGGGGSAVAFVLATYAVCSPRRRRWFGGRLRPGHLRRVLSAQAEVVRTRQHRHGTPPRALRAGGGGSSDAVLGLPSEVCSHVLSVQADLPGMDVVGFWLSLVDTRSTNAERRGRESALL